MAKPTAREKKFISALLADPDMNATKAAIAAGYSPKGAGVTGHKLLKKAKIAQLKAEKVKAATKDFDVTADRILQELAKLALYDPRKLFDEDGRCKPIGELDDETAAAVAGLKTVNKVSGEDSDAMVVFTDYKLADKGANLERLGRYFKLFTDKQEHSGPDGGAIPVSLEIDL